MIKSRQDFHRNPEEFANFFCRRAAKMLTAGLPISWTVGRCPNFCCWNPILIPRPDSETSAQTTRVNVLGFLVKPKNGISASYTERR